MDTKAMVTILVAVLNKTKTIENCIESLVRLNYPNYKILVLDGGSKDGTYKILQKYQDKIGLHQLPIGHSERMNWALDHTQTEYLAMTDADCVVDPDWLTKLIKCFDGEENVIAAAGYCGTPKGLSMLQTLIGLELENRFKKFPRYLYRAPTMNLCLKTNIARRVRFDEKQKVAIETDFGFRLTKLGKMIYTPEAKVWHYHRSTLKDYFNQQKNQAKWGLRLLFKHRGRALSDPITTFSMTVQIPLFIFLVLFLIASLFNQLLLYPALISFLFLFFIYIRDIIKIKPPLSYYPAFFALFLFRTTAWVSGIIQGVFLIHDF